MSECDCKLRKPRKDYVDVKTDDGSTTRVVLLAKHK